ncbi:hypothetical protein TIFTF001_009605 [Ficus carica]|uniref:Uncharacterized protein n=1 Tax=Ficus carica TaxID=3494 RepID=A0AA88A748_FICCA|nr:hypothetical protein TIFTF001_009605 [Ficus carica]
MFICFYHFTGSGKEAGLVPYLVKLIFPDHKVPLSTILDNGKAIPVCSESGREPDFDRPGVIIRPTLALQAPPTYYYCSTSHRHLPPHTLVEPAPAGTGDNHPHVPYVGSGPSWRQFIVPVAPASLSPSHPSGTLGSRPDRVAPSTRTRGRRL